MHIWRRGSASDSGEKYTDLVPKIGYSATDKVVVFNADNVSEFNTNAHHDWVISVSLNEMSKMIVAAANF